MKQDCRNDCLEELIFPKRPLNRPSLSHIDYRIGTYSDFRQALLQMLNRDPVLKKWTHRGAEDPGIALLEGTCILSDILTFYQELYANEAYLPTAVSRENTAGLVRLLGYRLAPGLGGKATFAIEVKGNEKVLIPAGFPMKAQLEGSQQPAEFETADDLIAYPWLNRFNLYRPTQPNPDPVEFHISSTDPNADALSIEKGDSILVGDRSKEDETSLLNAQILIVDRVRELHGQKIFRFKGTLGNPILPNNVAFKLGRSFRHFGYNAPSKIVTIKPDGTPRELSTTYSRFLSRETTSKSNGDTPVNPGIAEDEFPIEGEIHDLPHGVTLVVQGLVSFWNVITVAETSDFVEQDLTATFEAQDIIDLRSMRLQRVTSLPAETEAVGNEIADFTILRTLQRATIGSMTWGSLIGAATFLHLDASLANIVLGDTADVRRLEFHEVIGPSLKVEAFDEETAEDSGELLNFYGTKAEAHALLNRNLIFVPPDVGAESFTRTVVSVDSSSSDELQRGLRQITLDSPVHHYSLFPNEDPTVTVYGNLVEASQGRSERETVLGNGDSREEFQTFKLPKSPLTYLNSVDDTPPQAPELRIHVNDLLWNRVASFFGKNSDERIYIVREDANGDSWVQFGDGKTGARLPSGMENVVAKYRTGVGASGPLKQGTTVQPEANLERMDKIQLLTNVTGGTQPERGENAKEAAPGKVQSLGRLVSLKDFETEAHTISGVTKARAIWQLQDNIPTVGITLLLTNGGDGEFDDVSSTLNGYNRHRGPQRFPLKIRQGKLAYCFVDAEYGYANFGQEFVEKAVRVALGTVGEPSNAPDGTYGLFGLRSRQFGDTEYASRIEAAIQNVVGVVWARVTGFGPLTSDSKDIDSLPLPDQPRPISKAVSCDSDRVLALHSKHLSLTGTAVQPKEAR